MSVPSSQQGPREMKQSSQFDHLEDEQVSYYMTELLILMYDDIICVLLFFINIK